LQRRFFHYELIIGLELIKKIYLISNSKYAFEEIFVHRGNVNFVYRKYSVAERSRRSNIRICSGSNPVQIWNFLNISIHLKKNSLDLMLQFSGRRFILEISELEFMNFPKSRVEIY
jgi:hypothetical protein